MAIGCYPDVVQGMFGSWYGGVGWGGVGWGGANNVPWHLHLVCATVATYAATLADVVNLREQKFHGMSIILVC